jgi:hypothetical protein
MRMGRPVGVTILAILNFIGAAICLLGGIGMILGGGFIATMLSQQGQGSAGAAGILAGLGAAGRSVHHHRGRSQRSSGIWYVETQGMGAHCQHRSVRDQRCHAVAWIAWLFGPFQRVCCCMEPFLGRGRRLRHLVPAQAGSEGCIPASCPGSRCFSVAFQISQALGWVAFLQPITFYY